MDKEKYYIITYPSMWGMGSDTEKGLITGTNLRKLILMETGRYRRGEFCADSRFSGTWDEEVFCDSEDPEECVADVINKRLNVTSTYAGHNDLILLPDDTDIGTDRMTLGNTIVRLCNQYMCGRDIIFGEGEFNLYRVKFGRDFSEEYGMFHLDEIYRFVDYSLKNVAEYHMGGLSDIDRVLASEKSKLERMSAKRDGFEIKHKGAYITDLVPEMADDDYIAESIAEAKSTIEKFTNLPEAVDEYYRYMYDPKNIRSEYLREYIVELCGEDRKKDHTRYVFDLPICPDEFGTDYTIKRDGASRYLSYAELFKKGYDMQYYIAELSDSIPDGDDFGSPDLTAVLAPAFGYD